MFKEAESRPDKIESTSNNVQVRKKQQHRRRACDLLASLKRFYWPRVGGSVLIYKTKQHISKWLFQLRFSSRETPKKLKLLTLSIGKLFIFIFSARSNC